MSDPKEEAFAASMEHITAEAIKRIEEALMAWLGQAKGVSDEYIKTVLDDRRKGATNENQ